MLATLVIALREGLEAALIVGIIAAFLRKNGKSLYSMWVGVLLAIALSLLVGIGLSITERSLPQASQEAMEAVIGLVAVFFVTGMVLWMNNHGHEIKRQLEKETAHAIRQSSARALAIMAFLAVLKEGFETSVFLLATFSAAQSAALAATGAVLGLILAIAIGWGIYIGGVRLNLGRFFRYTGLFLILVAAGLVISALRSGHEAGWLNIGQQPVVNLSQMIPTGSIRSALITGVLGIPTDPRLLEVCGWGGYIVMTGILVFWPSYLRPGAKRLSQLLFITTGVLLSTAAVLHFSLPGTSLRLPATAPLQEGGTATLQPLSAGGYRLDVNADQQVAVIYILDADQQTTTVQQGVTVRHWTLRSQASAIDLPVTLTLDQVLSLSGNRIPVGLGPSQHPGPYTASWNVNCTVEAEIIGHALYRAAAREMTLMTLSGGGLLSPRTFSVRAAMPVAGCHWQLAESWHQAAEYALHKAAQTHQHYLFLVIELPLMLVLVAIITFVLALCRLAEVRRSANKAHADNSLSSE
ncbi:iron uptake transporter permease EfeU [Tatumella saanichensis]|uniref:iron uptake transporter permease EfeU n=1 Tax=Tatumella saanichensis TaxID=480813 RepID=UPI0004A2808E|nr:iron uptake transporter permease EfeU [Tatumella saanichensis]